ncbi:hypothetical protein NPIL_427261 [Nephila pilipes]|uniref:Uncharacterized protein n=1 Tax=Nephila pilipes TaxID=299642 RepID=A0A8X6P2A4_NEPPI|nr:hypothetical protein NPIL_216451 [Nephila pilipes]GFT71602.1 hypothetical protein NPIL_427261 [Nephila pilipes]
MRSTRILGLYLDRCSRQSFIGLFGNPPFEIFIYQSNGYGLQKSAADVSICHIILLFCNYTCMIIIHSLGGAPDSPADTKTSC